MTVVKFQLYQTQFRQRPVSFLYTMYPVADHEGGVEDKRRPKLLMRLNSV